MCVEDALNGRRFQELRALARRGEKHVACKISLFTPEPVFDRDPEAPFGPMEDLGGTRSARTFRRMYLVVPSLSLKCSGIEFTRSTMRWSRKGMRPSNAP